MYFTISYDILTTDTARATTAREFVRNCVTGLRWVKPLSNMYIVTCNDEGIRRAIFQRLLNYSRENPGNIRFLVTPLIDTGQVIGVASRELWPHIKRITQTDDGYNNPDF
jgi:hypothetical protein